MNLEHCHSVLHLAGIAFEPGLSPEELAAAERRFGFTFPPDLRAFLAFALPTGGAFPNWRNLDDPGLAQAVAWPLKGMYFDIEHNTFWPSEWGNRPSDLQAAFALARAHVAKAPKLIPVNGHRYMPDRPSRAGNPIFSVYQTDIIYYGADLENYLQNEYHYFFGTPEYSLPSAMRNIEFWSWLAEL